MGHSSIVCFLEMLNNQDDITRSHSVRCVQGFEFPNKGIGNITYKSDKLPKSKSCVHFLAYVAYSLFNFRWLDLYRLIIHIRTVMIPFGTKSLKAKLDLSR